MIYLTILIISWSISLLFYLITKNKKEFPDIETYLYNDIIKYYRKK
jgi:hypothetical protein